MPPVLLLKGDKDFYGSLAPVGLADPQKLERPAPPPNPMSNVKLSNEFQRQNVVERIENDLKITENLESKEKPIIQAELQETNLKKLQKQDDIGSRFVKFLTEPVVETTEKEKEVQKQRVASRIVGDESIAPVSNEIRPGGEVPAQLAKNVKDFIDDKLFMAVLVVGGIYLAGQFIQGVGKSVSKKSDKSD